MRTLSILFAIVLTTLSFAACGSKSATAPAPKAQAEQAKKAPDTLPAHSMEEALAKMPKDEAHKGLGTSPHGGGMGMMGGAMNTVVHLDPAIRSAWSGVRIKVTNRKTGASTTYDVPLGSPTKLGSSGLTLTADSFVPDFVMGADGITSRSPNPKNTAAHVVISEKGKPDFKGWLFGTMPDIHPFPHDLYEVTLDSGIPAKK